MYRGIMEQQSYEILLALRTSGGKLPISWLRALTEEQHYAFDLLIKDGLVFYTDGELDGMGGMCNYQTVSISDKGKFLLSAEERRRNDVADHAAREAEEKRANDKKAVVDKKKSFRHDFHVAAFSVALTLFLEHISDVIDFAEVLLKRVMLLFQ